MNKTETDTYPSAISRIKKIWLFYYEGFKSMTVGKTLWTIILLKLFILFAVLRLFFFPDILSRDYNNDRDRADHVRKELIRRQSPPRQAE